MDHVAKAQNSSFLSVPFAYAESIIKAGGLPFFIPPQDDLSYAGEITSILDGFLFIGGDDYRPENYGGRDQPDKELVSRLRDKFDLAVAKFILEKTQMPVLGICGGHQLINIADGGALIQDIRSEWQEMCGKVALLHAKNERKGRVKDAFRHPVRLLHDSLIAVSTRTSAKSTLLTNSFHHQAVHPEKIGVNFRASAWSEDGIIEAIEPANESLWKKTGRFVLGVQWHPERMLHENPHLNIFKALVRAAGNN